jgi:hypothetical protein
VFANAKVIVFNAGFAEANDPSTLTFGTQAATYLNDDISPRISSGSRHFEDSDDEDEEMLLDTDEDHSPDLSDSDHDQSRNITMTSAMSTILTEDESDDTGFAETDDGEHRNTRQKLTHPSSPRTNELERPSTTEQEIIKSSQKPMTRVIVQDASFSTYRSVLYYASRFCSLLLLLTALVRYTLTASCLLRCHQHSYLIRSLKRHRPLCHH